jgi:predicted TIM-barrel fold metal-dependent hydrolase
MDRHGVSRAALFGSAPGEQTAISRAVRAQPDRFVPFQMINPRAADAPALLRDLVERGIRGLLLFPAMHGYFPDEPVCRPVYETAREHKMKIFVHLGRLHIAIRDKLGLKSAIDERFGYPARLSEVLREFADVDFIVPHFAGGTLADLLPRIAGVRNLYLDTSSSNSWMAESATYPDLTAVFRAVLEHADLGPQRILFGSDSTVFPRGFRADLREKQQAALESIGAPQVDREAIFGGNFERVFA